MSYQRISVVPRSATRGLDRDRGRLTERERGDSFTEPRVYKNTTNITAQLKRWGKERELLAQSASQRRLRALAVSSKTERELGSGARLPMTRSELSVTQAVDDAAVVGEAEPLRQHSDAVLGQLMHRERDRRGHAMDRFAQPPSAREFHTLLTQLRAMDGDEGVIEGYQRRLVEEHGVYPTNRIDAFMLDEDSHFPDWVHALPYRLRDRVKYGALGLTEEDEALRIHLARIPRDRRLREWRKLKAAKEYKAAHEERVSLAELRDGRQGKRRFHWLQRKRQARAATLRRLAMRKPDDGYTMWPSTVVDYSQRLAFIARHVENGVHTGGQWPLDSAELTRATLARHQRAAERMFLVSQEEKAAANRAGSASPSQVEAILSSFDTPTRPFKRLSRRVYANRVNAAMHGDQDEYGRRYRQMHNRSTRRVRPYDSMREIAVEKEVRKEPRVNMSGLNHTDDENWSHRHTRFAAGIPSTRYTD